MLSVILIAASCANFVKAESFYLEGIGYREQELQVSKGSFFESEEPNGVAYASFAGGTHIFMKGVGLADNPQSNDIILYSKEFDMEVPSFALTEDDAFNSNPMIGTISYRLPALDKLFGIPMNLLDQYNTMTFVLSVVSNNDLGSDTMECGTASKCTIVYRKH